MEEKRTSNKSLWVVSLLLLSVVIALIVMFALRPIEEREGIILPEINIDPAQDQVTEEFTASGFLQIDADNIIAVLDSLKKPEYYHQTYEVVTASGRSSSIRTVEIWVNGPWIHAEVSDERTVKSIFTDGEQAWIWYDQDLIPAAVTLNSDVLLEDLLGIPNFDYQVQMEKSVILDAGYAHLEENLLQYIFVLSDAGQAKELEYWFAIDTGLLYRCSGVEDEIIVYDVRQTTFEQLAYGDQAFEGRFCLPDGTVPFSTEVRMLLP